MYALVKKEVRSFLSLLIGYIVISVFLLLVGLFLWVFPFAYNIPESGYARLDSLFDLAPWVFLFLIPAITMRSFAEERRNGTIELLFTKPLTDTQIILSKYIGGLVLVLFSLLPTFIYYFSIRELGNPPGNIDNGGTFGSYIGLLMIGATFVAVGIFCSSLTQNQVVAFIIAVFLCFFLYLAFDLLASFSRFGNFDSFVRGMGIFEHYQSIKRGVVDTRDLLYFITVITLFVLFTKFILEKRKRSTLPQFFITTAIVILINFIGSFAFLRFDLTEEKIHSLSPATIDFLENKTVVKLKDKTVKGNIDIKVYLTGDLPADLKYLEKAIKEKLDDMRSYVGDRLNYEFIDPYRQEDEAEQKKELSDIAQNKKIKYTELQYEEDGTFQKKYIFPGASISFEGRPEVTVQFFTKEVIYKDENQLRALAWAATDQLEYKLIDGIRNAKDQIRPSIAILQGHGEANKDDLHYITGNLRDFYTVDYVKINEKIKALDAYQMLLVVQPDSAFSERDKFVIDQFAMRGGKIAWFVDPMHVYADTLFKKGQTFGLSADLNLDDQLFTYGVRLNKDIVIDKTSAPINVPGYPGNFIAWPFYPYVYPKTKHPVVRNLNPIKFEYASTIDFVGDTIDVKKTVLLTTSDKSVIYKAPVRINYGIVDVEPFGSNNIQPNLKLGVLLEGKFKSVFRNRLPEAFTKSSDYKFLETSKSTRMLVVGDGDVVKNYYIDSVYIPEMKMFTKKYLKLERDRYEVRNKDGSPVYIYGNGEFLLNAVDYLMGDESLIELRQRTLTIRKLDDVRIMKEKGYWQFMNIGMPVILIIIFGVIQYFIRKKKYASTPKS
jgi:ABC-2 type transport system permease protein